MENTTFLKIEGERECYCKTIVKPYLIELKNRLAKIKDEREKTETETRYTTMLKLYARSLGVTPERLEGAVFGA